MDRAPEGILIPPKPARFSALAALALAVACLGCISSVGNPSAAHAGTPAAAPLPKLATNRSYEVLSGEAESVGSRALLREAGLALGDWKIHLAGVSFDGPRLIALGEAPADEPLLRFVRESLGRAIDLQDFFFFLDDVLKAGEEGRRGEDFYVTSSRARSAGILVHPDDVFSDEPRLYGVKATLAVDRPRPRTEYSPAQDGEVLGPRWTMRFSNPNSEKAMLAVLEERRPESAFASRIHSLILQLRQQGAKVWLNSTLRNPERGYLMWGAFLLSRAVDDAELREIVMRLQRANRDWGLDVAIEWMHPDGLAATREAARQMADAYEVVYATQAGARASDHYSATAVDLVALGLPRSISLVSPLGESARFDLSDPAESRDLSLSPALIRWIEEHFELAKLRSDYPHWTDAR